MFAQTLIRGLAIVAVASFASIGTASAACPGDGEKPSEPTTFCPGDKPSEPTTFCPNDGEKPTEPTT